MRNFDSQKIILTLIAERDVLFFIGVAKVLRARGHSVSFLTFYEPAISRVSEAEFEVFNIHAIIRECRLSELELDGKQIESTYGIDTVRDLIRHERLTFRVKSEDHLIDKAGRYIWALERWISQVNVDIVIQELGGFIAPLSLFHVCNKNNVRHLFIEPMLFKGTIGFLENALSYKIPKTYERKHSCYVEEYIQNYLRTHYRVIPVKDQHHFLPPSLSRVLSQRNFKSLTKKLWNKYIRREGQEYEFLLPHIIRSAKAIFNSRKLKRYYISIANTKGSSQYVFFPMHVPLDYQLTVRSPEWLDQIALIKQIADLLPHGFELWTKEHPAAIGAYSISELMPLLSQKNVKLISPMENAFSIIGRAKAVITINSKVGAESLMQNKKVFVLGDAFYRNQDVCADIDSIPDLKAKLNEYLKQENLPEPERHDVQMRFFTSVWAHSFPGELYVNSKRNLEDFCESLITAIKGKKTLRNQLR